MVVSLAAARWLTHKKTYLKAGGTMPKKASAKGAKKSDKEKKPTRPTRCDESFRWTPRPPLVEAAATNNTARLVAAQVPVKCLLLLLLSPPPSPLPLPTASRHCLQEARSRRMRYTTPSAAASSR